MNAPSNTALFSKDGTIYGSFEVPDAGAFYVGAYCILSCKEEPDVKVNIINIIGNTIYVAKSGAFFLVDLSNFRVSNGAMVTMPAQAVVGPIRIPNALSSTQISQRAINVKDFGAVGDGIADDTAVIQFCIDKAGQAGGGIVFFPTGNYRIQPQASGQNCLNVNYDNIWMQGPPDRSAKLTAYVFGGGIANGHTPGVNFEVINGQVWRGHTIYINCNGGIRRGFVISNMEIFGTGNWQSDLYPVTGASGAPFPADPVTGNGFDLSHKCIYFDDNSGGQHYGHRVENCTLHGYRGEMIYGSGVYLQRIFITGNDMYDTNGGMVDISGELYVSNNRMHDSYSLCEPTNNISNQFWTNNRFYNCSSAISCTFSVVITPTTGWGKISFHNNLFQNCYKQGFWVSGSTQNIDCMNNTFTDCGQGGVNEALRVFPQNGGTPSRVMISDNVFEMDQYQVNAYIRLYGSITDVVIQNNVIRRSTSAIASGFTAPTSIEYNLTAGAKVKIFDNKFDYVLLPDCGAPSVDQAAVPWFKNNVFTNYNAYQSIFTDNFNPTCEIAFASGTNNNDISYATRIRTAGFQDGQVFSIYPISSTNYMVVPASGTGFKLKKPRTIGPAKLVLTFNASTNIWVETDYVPVNTPVGATSDIISTDCIPSGRLASADGVVLRCYGCAKVFPQNPSAAFTSIVDYPINEQFSVWLSAGQSLVNSANIVLAGGVNFAPANGGIINLIYSSTTSKIYEINRLSF